MLPIAGTLHYLTHDRPAMPTRYDFSFTFYRQRTTVATEEKGKFTG